MTHLFGQAVEDQKIAFNYQKTPIREALADLEHRYHLVFAYSVDLMPLDHPLTARTPALPVPEAMKVLFERAPVDFMMMQRQIVLRHAPDKPIPDPPKEQLTQRTVPVKKETPFYRRIAPKPIETIAASGPPQQLPGGDRTAPDQFNLGPLLTNFRPEISAPERTTAPRRRLGQVSLVPWMGTNRENTEYTINHLSLNVIGGVSGGVEGVEIGGLYNEVRGDVFGMQISGGINLSKGSLIGGQVAGLVNMSTLESYAIQVAGLANISKGRMRGTQIAGGFNKAVGEQSHAPLQIAGIGNMGDGRVRSQLAVIFNQADTVADLQMAGLINIAHKVEGQQVGLINIADSVSGTPLGLINLIRHGYNRVEFAGEEALFANLSLKLGNRKFYNIFRVGARWENTPADGPPIEGRDNENRTIHWGLGYGIGAAPKVGNRTAITSELMATQIDEGGGWTNHLNLLSQLRISFDVEAGSVVSFFAGPVVNVQFSKWRDPETGAFLSDLAPYTFWESEDSNLLTRAWVGFSAGVRVNPL